MSFLASHKIMWASFFFAYFHNRIESIERFNSINQTGFL